MNYNNCDKKKKDTYKEECSYKSSECKANYNDGYNYGYNNNCCCQNHMNPCYNQQPIDYKDSVLTCGGSVSSATTIALTPATPSSIGSISVNSSCIKCGRTQLTYNGFAVTTAAITTAGTITVTVNKVCGFNSTPAPIGQVTIPVATTLPVGSLIPISFQVCDSLLNNCNYNNCCCNNTCGNFCSYTITASTTATAATGAAAINITGNSLTALTSSSNCCGCCCY